MNRTPTPSSVARSWRDIPQEIAPRSMSAEGRKRLTLGFLKGGLVVITLAVVAWAAWSLWETWQQNPTKLVAPVKSERLRAIELKSTDGVLDQAWVEQQLALPKGITLMELQLPKLQQRLLADGQVRTAILMRKFPDTLVVTLQERFPVGRLRAADRFGQERDYLVARDGVMFTGTNFPAKVLAAMPWLGGLKLVRFGDGFQPLAGMDTVAELVENAREHAPHLYQNWHVISLERLANDGEIVVRTDDRKEIVFGLRDNFFTQIAMLDAVLNDAARHPEKTLASINLALGTREVHAAYAPDSTAVAPGAPHTPASAPRRDGALDRRPPTRPGAATSRFTLQSTQPRKTTRDL